MIAPQSALEPEQIDTISGCAAMTLIKGHDRMAASKGGL
jgi:hypothetical protein